MGNDMSWDRFAMKLTIYGGPWFQTRRTSKERGGKC